MKNFYLFIAGIALLASGIQFVSNFSGDDVSKNEFSLKKTETSHAPEIQKIPYLPLNKTGAGGRFLVPAITATNTYLLTSDTGLSGASAGDELEYTVTISNSGTDASAVVFTDQIDLNTTLVAGSVKVSPIAQNDSYTTIGNVGLNIAAVNGVLANDLSPNNATLSVAGPASIATTQGGTVTMNLTTGGFTYEPAAGFIGADSFTYTLENGSGLTTTGTVTVTLTGAIWFINAGASASGANGTLAKPFTSISSFQAINDNGALHPKTGHSIFVYTGNYTGNITLLAQQKLIGQGAGESLLVISGLAAPNGANLLPATGGTRPALTTSGGTVNAINVGTNNTVRGLNVGNTSGTKLTGSLTGTLTIKEVALTGTGRAIDLSNGTLAAEFSEVSSTIPSGSTPFNISNSAGSLKIVTGTIAATGATAIQIAGNSLALDVIFVSVSSSGASKGVSVSGTTGTFQINGTGTTVGSGGTIQNITGRGMEFINSAGITLKNINLINANTAEGTLPAATDNSNSNAAFHANTVAGLAMDRVAISGTVVQEGINLRGVSDFNFTNGSVGASGSATQSEEGCIYAVNTSGTCTITNSTFTNPGGRVAYFTNNNTNLTLLTVDNSTFKDAVNGPGIQMEGRGTSQMKLKVQNNCQFLRCRTTGLEVYANNTSSIQADIKNCNIDNGGVEVGNGVDIAAANTATVKFNVLNNTTNSNNGPAINFLAFENGYLEGNVTGNTITKNGGGGSGIAFSSEGASAHGVVKIDNNTLNGYHSGSGINIMAISTASARNDLTIDNNTIRMADPGSLYGIDLNTVGSVVGNNARICGNLTNNKVTMASSTLDALRARSGLATTQILMQGTGGTVIDVWNNNGNTPPGSANESGGGPFLFGQTCAVPNVPALRVAASEESTVGNMANAIVVDSVKIIQEKFPPVKKVRAVQKSPAANLPDERTETTQSGETVTVNGAGSGFSLPANKSVIIKFRVIINSNIPVSTCQVSNQGSVSGTGFTTVLTDNPNVAGASNPTVTTVVSAPVINFCPGDLVVNPDAGTCTSTRTLAATAQGCPSPVLTYRVGANVITFPYVFPSGATTVLVTAANGVGANATCSFTVTVTPTPAPIISNDPDAQTICAGGNTSFTVETTQAGVTYQWQKKPFGGAFANINSAVNATAIAATLSLTNVPAADDKSEYRCVISNPCTNSTSAAALLTVNQITASSLTGSTVVNQGAANPSVTFGATGGTLPYTFNYKINNGSQLNVTTATAQTTANVTQSTSNVGIFSYQLVNVTDAQGCVLTPSLVQTAVITVANNLVATISGGASVCKNAVSPQVTFTATNGIAPFTFTYKIGSGPNVQATTTGSNTTASVAVPTAATGTFVYELVSVSGSGGAATPVAGQTATVVINDIPTIALAGAGYQCSVNEETYTVFFAASVGAVVTSDKGTVVGNTVINVPTNETVMITATLGTCTAQLSAFKNCSLPVTLINFTAERAENTIVLKWKTSAEQNSEKFEIERSTNGKSWKVIGRQKSTGESASVANYSFTDAEPVTGENLYRLKMVDLDQTFAYSRIVNIHFNSALKSEFYPNPVSELLTLKSTDWNQVSSVEMYDIQGRLVYKSGKSISKTISVKTFPVGMYVLSISSKDGSVENKKVLINR